MKKLIVISLLFVVGSVFAQNKIIRQNELDSVKTVIENNAKGFISDSLDRIDDSLAVHRALIENLQSYEQYYVLQNLIDSFIDDSTQLKFGRDTVNLSPFDSKLTYTGTYDVDADTGLIFDSVSTVKWDNGYEYFVEHDATLNLTYQLIRQGYATNYPLRFLTTSARTDWTAVTSNRRYSVTWGGYTGQTFASQSLVLSDSLHNDVWNTITIKKTRDSLYLNDTTVALTAAGVHNEYYGWNFEFGQGGYIGGIRDFNMYLSGNVYTKKYDYRSMKLFQPSAFNSDSVTINYFPISKVINFATTGASEFKYTKALIETTIPADYLSMTNTPFYLHYRTTTGSYSDAYIFLEVNVDGRIIFMSDTIYSNTDFDDGTFKLTRQDLMCGKRSQQRNKYVTYADPRRGDELNIALHIFTKNATVDIADIGFRYFSSGAAGSETVVGSGLVQYNYNDSTARNTIVHIPDLQPANDSQVATYISPELEYAKALLPDYITTPGDNTDSSETALWTMKDSIVAKGLDTMVLFGIGNHDTYKTLNKSLYKALLDTFGISYEIAYQTDTSSTDNIEMVNYLKDIGNNLVLAFQDMIRDSVTSTPYVNPFVNFPDTTWICNKLDSLKTAGKDVILIVHPALYQVKSGYPGQGLSLDSARIYRQAVSRKTNLIAILKGHDEVDGIGIEENYLPMVGARDYAQTGALNLIYVEAFYDYVRVSVKRYAGSYNSQCAYTTQTSTLTNMPKYEELNRFMVFPRARSIIE